MSALQMGNQGMLDASVVLSPSTQGKARCWDLPSQPPIVSWMSEGVGNSCPLPLWPGASRALTLSKLHVGDSPHPSHTDGSPRR